VDLPREQELALARRLILAVGLAYLLAQLLAFALDRPPGWDEAIYLSQVTPDAAPLTFVPSRARGITLLAIPVLQLGGSLTQLRVFLAVASSLLLAVSYRRWVPVVGLGAAAGALLFAGSWPALFYGSELMPNLWLALIAVAATAVLGRRLATGEGRSDELLAGGLVALAAFVRPLDAAVLAAVLVLVPVAFRRTTLTWSILVPLGFLVGWVPWLVEMSVRFGSLGEAFRVAAHHGHSGRWVLGENVRQYLALSDGPPLGPVARPDLPLIGALSMVGLIALVVLGLRHASRRGLARSLVVPTVAGLAFAVEYVAFTDAQAPRFLLPALAQLAVPAGLGVLALLDRVREGSMRAAVIAAVAALTVVWLVAQLAIASVVEDAVTRQRRPADRAGQKVRTLAEGDRCRVLSDGSFPIVGYASGCSAAPIASDASSWPERAERLEQEGITPFLVLLQPDGSPPPGGASELARIRADGERSWVVYGWG
jgi:hypothetical protein